MLVVEMSVPSVGDVPIVALSGILGAMENQLNQH